MDATGELVGLRPKRPEDAIDDYTWRTDPELATFDAVQPLRMSFPDFQTLFQEELRYPTPRQRTYGIEDLATGRHIGNCMFYDIDEFRHQAELGIMIGDKDFWGQGYGTDAVVTLIEFIFRTTGLNRVYLHTLDWNVRAQKSFAKAGFVAVNTVTRRGFTFVTMEILREAFESGKLRRQPAEGAGERRSAAAD